LALKDGSRRVREAFGPLTGLAFVVLTAAAGVVGDPNRFEPGIGPSESATVIATALIENRDAARTSAYLTLGGTVFLFFFLGYLREALRRAEAGADGLASVAFGAGLVVAALNLVGASVAIAVSELPSNDPVVAKTLLTYGWDYYAVLAAPATAVVAATAIVVLRGASLPRWFGWFSALTGAALVLLLIGRTAGLGTIAFLVWALTASVALWLADRRSSVGET